MEEELGLRIHAVPKFDTTGKPEYTDEGFRIFRSVKIARSGLFAYGANELAGDGVFEAFPQMQSNAICMLMRPPETFTDKVVQSCYMKPVSNDHPSGYGRMIVPLNAKKEQVGALGSNPHFDGEFLITDVIIYDHETLSAIENGKYEVSIGFLHKKPVQFIKDSEYIAEEWIVTINHLAIVVRGRAGPECRLNEDMEPDAMTIETVDKNSALDTENLSRINSTLKETSKSISDLVKIVDHLVSRVNAAEEKDKTEEDAKRKAEKEAEAKVNSKKEGEEKEDKESDDEARKNDMFYTGFEVGSLLDAMTGEQIIGWVNGQEITGRSKTKIVKMAKDVISARQNRETIFNGSNVPLESKEITLKDLFMTEI